MLYESYSQPAAFISTSACRPQALPGFLGSLLDRLQAAGVFTAEERPNHCLVNSYERAAACPLHQDGPLCACFTCSMLPVPFAVLRACLQMRMLHAQATGALKDSRSCAAEAVHDGPPLSVQIWTRW
jgi:hypothetical protein